MTINDIKNLFQPPLLARDAATDNDIVIRWGDAGTRDYQSRSYPNLLCAKSALNQLCDNYNTNPQGHVQRHTEAYIAIDGIVESVCRPEYNGARYRVTTD